MCQSYAKIYFRCRSLQIPRNNATLIKDATLIATAPLNNGLYEIDVTTNQSHANLCKVEDASLWHKRFGHIGQNSLNEIIRKQCVLGLDIKPGKIGFCDSCVEDPFSGTRVRAERPLERIHSDVCGPIDPTAWDGSRYFVSFMDDFSHFGILYNIKNKSDVFSKFVEYEAQVSAQFGYAISKLWIKSVNTVQIIKLVGIRRKVFNWRQPYFTRRSRMVLLNGSTEQLLKKLEL